MKYFLLLAGLAISGLAFSQHKFAMIVAVGTYPADSKLPPIASASDVKYIQAALNKNGFADKDIVKLINAKATKDAILNQLTLMAAKAKKNDIVVLHFGCHGQQIRDQKTVELGKDEDDGYDEALLPYDAKGRYSPTGYKGEKHLRDDDLFPKLMAIRQKIGPGGSLLVLLDACHSGTGTRSESFGTTRGEPVPFPDPENPMDAEINLSAAEAKEGFFEAMADSISNMVVISGSSPHQENKQVIINYEELGSLSYAFYKAISEMSAGNTYELLFEKIRATIQAIIPDQIPMIEGNVNQVIFSGKYTAKEDKTFIRVGYKGSTGPQDSVFTVDKGLMDNMAVGTSCKIYKAGSNELVATAVIQKVENFKSIGVADKSLDKKESYVMKQDEENYGSLVAALKLKLDGPAASSAALSRQVKNFIKPYKFLSIAENADFQLEVKDTAGGKLATLVNRNNKLLWTATIAKDDSLSAQDEKAFITSIKKELKVKYLRTMPDGGDLSQYIEATITPAKEYDPLRGVELSEGEGYSLTIRNKSNQKLYYTVLDIYPDNNVEVLYPYKTKEPADYIIPKNDSVVRRLSVSKNSPQGVEFLKIIVSKEPMDLRGVFEKKIVRDEMRSFQVVLDDLLNEKDEKGTRADISSIKAEEIGIVTVNFTIKQK
jgi:hypothetical protein